MWLVGGRGVGWRLGDPEKIALCGIISHRPPRGRCPKGEEKEERERVGGTKEMRRGRGGRGSGGGKGGGYDGEVNERGGEGEGGEGKKEEKKKTHGFSLPSHQTFIIFFWSASSRLYG